LIFFASAAPSVRKLSYQITLHAFLLRVPLGLVIRVVFHAHLSAEYLQIMLTPSLQIVSQVVTEKRPLDTIAVGAVARVLETVGLSLFLTYWGTRTNPFD
jgi:hypothetical protein